MIKVYLKHKQFDYLIYDITVSNCRPISLLPVFGKIFEKVMHHRIYSFLWKYILININQVGFCSNQSTEHALKSLIKTIKKSLDDDEIGNGDFIDLRKALDSVSHEIVLENQTIME